jgi:hypothetical protein
MSVHNVTPSGIEDYVKMLSEVPMSYTMIIKECKSRGIPMNRSKISRILNIKGKIRRKQMGFEVSPRKPRPRIVRTRKTIRSITKKIMVEHPPSRRDIVKDHRMSLSTLNKLIHQDIGVYVKKKPKIHALNACQRKRRKTVARKLYELYLSGDKYKNVVTIDEAWVYISNSGQKRSIYYRKYDGSGDQFWGRCRERFPDGFMVVAGICHKGKLPLIKVPKKVKINSDYYIKYVIEPYYEEIKRLYPKKELSKTYFHHDRASSHVSKKTLKKLDQLQESTGIRYISPCHTPVKSPDIAPMDFSMFGILKTRLWKYKPRTVTGLWNASKKVWKNIPMPMVRNTLMSWKKRCRLVVKRKGSHIENIRHLYRNQF